MTTVEKNIRQRSNSVCELSGQVESLVVYTLPPYQEEDLRHSVLIHTDLLEQILHPEKMQPQQWRFLSDSMWSEHMPVQVLSWRMLHRLKSEGWSQDLLDMMYLDEETLAWAEATGDHLDDSDKITHKDVNGNVLQDGDSVVLIKDLDVKGASFTAKRGAAVHNIKLVWDNAEQIEGRVEGQHIVILTQYVKKTK